MDSRDKLAINVIKHLAICFTVTLGVAANTIGLIAMNKVGIGFPATRLLLRVQFITDLIGCISTAAYWITFNLTIPPELLTGTAFSYFWSSYYIPGILGVLSSNNMVSLSVDRYWAVVRFRTYRHDSKCYRMNLLMISWAIAILGTAPSPILSYFQAHIQMIGTQTLITCMRIQAIVVLLLGLIGPGIVISVLQIKVLLVVWRVRRSASNQANNKALDQNMIGISIGIIIMVIAFVVAKCYHVFQFALTMFGLGEWIMIDGWENDGLFSYSVSFCVNPLALVFTSPGARNWLFKKASNFMALIRGGRAKSSQNTVSQ